MTVVARRLFALAMLLGACASNRGAERARPRPPAPPKASASPQVADAGVVSPASARFGSAHPLTLIAASSSAQWVAFCQAREDTDGSGTIAVSIGPHGALSGDRLQPYLALAGGTLRPIDTLAAADPSGRFVVITSGAKLLLIDAARGTELDLSALGADARADASPYRSHRALAFDLSGSRLAYLRRKGASEQVVVRELASGTETTITPDAGTVWRIELEPMGSWVVLYQVGSANGSDPRARWPAPEAQPSSPCTGPIAPIAAWPQRSAPLTTALASTQGGAAKRTDGFVAALRAGIVIRESSGRLVLRAQTDTELAPSSCGARVMHADPARDLLVVACSSAKGRPPLELVSPQARLPLDVDIAFVSHDRAPREPTRLVPLYPGADSALLDLDTRRLIRLKRGDSVVTTSGARALVRRGDQLLVSDVETNIELRLPGNARPLSTALFAGDFAVVAPLVADVKRGRLLGVIEGEPLAIARDGRVLVAVGSSADVDRLAIGPLEWQRPLSATDTSQSASAAPD